MEWEGEHYWACFAFLKVLVIILKFNNCITRWKLGACSSSTFGIQLLEWIITPWLAQPPNPTIYEHLQKEKQAPVTVKKISVEKKNNKEGVGALKLAERNLLAQNAA